VIASHTQPEDLVLPNLQEMHPPFPQWDVGGAGTTKLTADRMFFLRVTNQNAMADLLRKSHGESPPVVFLRAQSEPIDPVLKETLLTHGQLISRIEFQPVVEPETWAEKLRFYYWRPQGKPYIYRTESAATQAQPVTLEFIRVTIQKKRSDRQRLDVPRYARCSPACTCPKNRPSSLAGCGRLIRLLFKYIQVV